MDQVIPCTININIESMRRKTSCMYLLRANTKYYKDLNMKMYRCLVNIQYVDYELKCVSSFQSLKIK